MLKKWNTKNYNVELILTIFNSTDVNIESMNKYSKTKNLRHKNDNKSFDYKEIRGSVFKAAEVRIKQLLGVRIDHTVLHFWEEETDSLHGGDSQCNSKRAL